MPHQSEHDSLLARSPGDPSLLQVALTFLRKELAMDALLLGAQYGVDPSELLDTLDTSLKVAQVAGKWTLAREVQEKDSEGKESVVLRDFLMEPSGNGSRFRVRRFSAICAYLWSILESKAQEKSKKFKRQRELLLQWASVGGQETESIPIDATEALVLALAEALDADELQCVRLHVVEGYSQDVVATALGLSRRQVQGALAKAYPKIPAALKRTGAAAGYQVRSGRD